MKYNLLFIVALFMTGYVFSQGSQTSLSCGVSSTYTLTASGFSGDDPTSATGSCGQCCYAGSDLDGDGDQDVSFSVENSKWYKYCNTTGAPLTIDFVVDEVANNCNLQGAVFVGGSNPNGGTDALDVDCSNQEFGEYGSNVNGGADGFSFTNVTIPTGGCAYLMVDGYAGAACSGGYTINTICPPLCTNPTTFTAGPDLAICEGNSAAINSTVSGGTAIAGAPTYSWSPTTGLSCTTCADPTASPTATTTYTMTACNGGPGFCCVTDQVTVTVTPNFTANAGPDVTACAPSNITIGGSGGSPTGPAGSTYSWAETGANGNIAISGSSTVANPTVAISAGATGSATYTVTVTNGACVRTDVVVVTVGSLLVNAGLDQDVCAGSSTTIGGAPTAPAGATFSWAETGANGGIQISGATNVANPTITVSAGATGTATYTVTATLSGCSNTDVVVISARPIPTTPTITASVNPICAGVSTTLTAAGGAGAGTYTWWDAASGGTQLGSANTLVVSPTSTTTYYLQSTDATYGCVSIRGSITITVNLTPVANAGTDITACFGLPIPLNGSVSNPAVCAPAQTWSIVSGSGIFSNANSLTSTFTPASTGTITLRLTPCTSGGCTAVSDDVVLTITAAPTVTASVTTSPICLGLLDDLGGTVTGGTPIPPAINSQSFSSGSGPFTIPDNNTAGVVIPISVSGVPNATLGSTTVTSVLGNVDHNRIGQVDVWLCPAGVATTSPFTGCINLFNNSGGNNDDLINTLFTDGSLVDIASGTAPYTGSFNPDGSGTLGGMSGSTNGTWNIVVVDGSGAGGTSGTSGQWTVTFGTPIPTEPYTYSWSPSTGLNSTTVLTPTLSTSGFSAPSTQVYTLTATDANGCSALSNVSIDIITTPTTTAGTDQTICGTSSTFAGNSLLAGETGVWTLISGSGTITTSGSATSGVTGLGTGTNVFQWTKTNSCGSTSDQVQIIVSPPATATISANASICAGASTNLTFTMTGLGTYDVVYTDGVSNFNLNNISSGHIISVSPGSTTTYSLVSVFDDGTGCTGTVSGSAVITVDLVPTVNDPADQVLCANTMTTAVTFSGNSGSTTYNWTNDNTSIGLGANGTGNIAAFSAVNVGATAQVATITVTPTLGTCTGTAQTFTITVNPIPTVNDPADQALCANTMTTVLTFSGNSGSTTYNWTNDNTSIGLGANGAGNIAAFSAVNVGATAQIATITVTPTLGACTGTAQTFTITVNPIPTVNDPADQALCANTMTTAVTFSGNSGSTTYNWTNDNTSIGLGANGTGNIAAFSAVNVGATAQVATITVTPTLGTCTGSAQTFTITVNPIPTVNVPTDQALCANTMTTAVTFSGNSGSTTYNWTNDNTSIGLGANGTGNIAGFSAVNVGATAQVATITVTPTLGTCTGSAQTFSITVNPIPTVNDPADQVLCANTMTTAVTFSGNSGSTTYNWTNDNTSIGLGANGTGNIAAFSAVNVGATAQVATITVTPTLGTCTGTAQTFTITVNPIPTFTTSMTNPLSCGASDGTITLSGLNASTGYSLSYSDDGIPVGPLGITSTAGGTYTITGLNAGGYSNIVIIAGGCNSAPGSVSLSDPSSPVFTISLSANPSTCLGTEGSIHIEGTGTLLPSTMYSLSYTDNGSGVGPIVIVTDVNGDYDILGLNAGTYTGFVLNLGGCIGSQPGPITLADPMPPIATAGTTTPTICDGATINLTGNTIVGASYSWSGPNTFTSPLEDPTIGSATTAASGTYTLIITLNNCSSAPSTVDVTVNATPILVITDPAAVCSPSAVNITAAAVTAGSTNIGTLSYWTDAGATSALAAPATVSASGTYYIQATNAGCTDINPVVVTVNATPNLVITNPAAVCSPSTIDLTLAAVTAGSTNVGTLSYWVDAGATSALASPSAVVSSGIYYIQATNSGCTDINPVTVTVNATPNLAITNPATVCSPSTVNITAAAVTAGSTNVGSLSYWNDAGATSSLATPSAVATSGTYYIQATNAGCSDIAAVVVDIVTTPDVVTNNPAAVCSPLTIDLTAAAVTSGSTNLGTLSYWTDAAATMALATPSAVSTSGTYYIQSGASGCMDIAPVVVTINASPVLTITNPVAVCSPSAVDITAAGVTAGSTNVGTLGYWTDSGATSSLATPSAVSTSGTYYIQATNAGCTDIEAVTVVVNSVPTFTIAGTDPTVCNASDGFVTLSGLNASASYDITYEDDGVAISSANYTSTAGGTVVIPSLSAGTYDNFTVTLTSTGCLGNSGSVVTLNNPGAPVLNDLSNTTVCDNYTLPAITGTNLTGNEAYWTASGGTGTQLSVGSQVTSTQTIYIYDINGSCADEENFTVTVNYTPNLVITDPGAVCTPSTVDITVASITSGSTNMGTLSYWTNASATTPLATPSSVATSGTYYIQSANGTCADVAQVIVTINQSPNLVITNPQAICAPGTIDLTLASVTAGSTNVGTLTYWTDAAATNSLVSPSAVNAGGVYYIQADNGCIDLEAVTVVINSVPGPPIASNDTTYCSSWDYSGMTVSGSGGTFTWYSDANTTNFLGTGSSLSPEDVTGTNVYYVTESVAGCESTPDSVIITIENCTIIVPTAFTPDNDGINDYWNIQNIDEAYPNNQLTVFNRWGNMLYQSKEGAYSSDPWRGFYNSELMPVGSYYYVLDFNNGKDEPQKGIVTIILK